MAIRNKENIVGQRISAFFTTHGISHKEAAQRLGYANFKIVDNYISLGKFGKRTAAKWAREFGFNEKFLMTGKGKVMNGASGYQKMKQENEMLKSIVLAQRKQIKELATAGHSSF